MNPYDWQSHNPTAQIPREEVGQAIEVLLEGGSAVVLGGRGMGKSVFLRQVMAELQRQPDTVVILIEAPPATLAVEACIEDLATTLGISGSPHKSRDIFDRYFAREDAPERLVLLFDEFDRYAEKGGPSTHPPGRGFFNDLEASRRSLPALSILAAGSIGVFIFRDVLGSSFLARALFMHLRPFDRGATEMLVTPFEEQARPLPVEALDALLLASGGIPALLTYGLQQVWRQQISGQDDEPTARDITAIYQAFEERYEEYLRDLLSALVDPRLSDAPRRVWEYIREHAGRIPRADLEACLGEPSGILRLNLTDALRLLEMSGAVRIEGSPLRDDPVAVRPIAGLLNLPGRSPAISDRREHFLRDLDALLVRLHRSSADFFRPGKGGAGKRLVPESVFAAYLALGFELLGWRSEREAQRGAGRTDLLLRRNGDDGVYIVEVKLWGRNDYREAHRQVESYWTDDVVAGAVVQLTDTEIDDWQKRYRHECLEPAGLTIEERQVEGSPIQARLSCASATAAGSEARIEHFLVRVSRR